MKAWRHLYILVALLGFAFVSSAHTSFRFLFTAGILGMALSVMYPFLPGS